MNQCQQFFRWAVALPVLLVMMACKTTDSPRGRVDPEETRRQLNDSRSRLSALQRKLDRVEAAEPAQLAAVIVDQGLADKAFFELNERKETAVKDLTDLGYRYLDGHPKIKSQKTFLADLEKQLAGKANWIRYQLTREVEVLQDTVDRLEKALNESAAP